MEADPTTPEISPGSTPTKAGRFVFDTRGCPVYEVSKPLVSENHLAYKLFCGIKSFNTIVADEFTLIGTKLQKVENDLLQMKTNHEMELQQ